MNKGKLAAIKLREDIGLDDPTDIAVEDVIIAQGGHVQFKPMGKVDGRIVYGKNISAVFINSDVNYEPRKRFAMAHELGHLIMHKGSKIHDDIVDAQWFTSTHENLKKGGQEYEANQFAAEYLMPADIFISFTNNKVFSPQLIFDLASRFLTSLSSVAYKYLESNLHPVALINIQDGKVRFWKKSEDFNVYLKGLTKLPPPDDSVAMEYINADYRPIYSQNDMAQSIEKSTYFILKEGEEDTEFFEFCIVNRPYRNILTIIWEP